MKHITTGSSGQRWAPSQEDLQEKAYEQLIPPLVYKIRLAVKEWRDSDYSGVSETTKALMQFAAFLENYADIISFAKKNQTLNFKIEYQGEDGNIHEFFSYFLIKKTEQEIYIAGNKGREDLGDVRKIKRLQIWCGDVNAAQNKRRYVPLYVKQEMWEKHQKDIKLFKDVIKIFSTPNKQSYIEKNISMKG